jgi:alpha-glucosidase
MDIKIDETDNGTQTTLEYNVIGGVLDFYFLAGSETDPTEVARQYAELVGMPAEMPYWAFGLHQCRYGYKGEKLLIRKRSFSINSSSLEDFVEVAEVISNYSAAGIPLETMWTDIDYMLNRLIFTNDPQYFPTNRVRDIVNFLHSHDQKYSEHSYVFSFGWRQSNLTYLASFDDGPSGGVST